MTPQRIQRKRSKGYNMQAESMALNGLPAMSVCRPGKWGNPNHVGRFVTPEEAVSMFKEDLIFGLLDFSQGDVVRELRGKNLACFCPLDQPCHSTVLLEIANK